MPNTNSEAEPLRPIQVLLDAETIAALRAEAERRRTSVSAIGRWVVKVGLDELNRRDEARA